VPPPPSIASRPRGRQSYSQQGEDLIVDSIRSSLGISNPTYLDIGAADPIQDSNTYLFYQKGFRGVLVEPNPAFARRLRSERPLDRVLNVGIGVTDQKDMDYYMIGGRDGAYLNTFSKEQAETIVARSEGTRSIEKVLKMPMVEINQIMKEYFPSAPTFVSIDVEGLDLAILKTLDFQRFRPAIVCAETLIIGTKRVETGVLELLKGNDYTIRGGTFVNTIFVDSRLLA
jgi:FkbM family methyltransferase